jgi:hypothetical protein
VPSAGFAICRADAHGHDGRVDLARASDDIWAVNTDFEYHEAQKIEVHHRGAVTAGR